MIHNDQYVSGDSDHLIPVDLDMSVPKKWDCSTKNTSNRLASKRKWPIDLNMMIYL